MSNYDYEIPGAHEKLSALLDLLTGDLPVDIIGSLSGGEVAIITVALRGVGDTAGAERYERLLEDDSDENNDGEDWEAYLEAIGVI